MGRSDLELRISTWDGRIELMMSFYTPFENVCWWGARFRISIV